MEKLTESMNAPHVLVCVTGQKTCERLILFGAQRAREMSCPLSVLHVAGVGQDFLGNPEEGEALEYLYEISSAHDADMTVMRAADALDTVASYARKIGATHILLGVSPAREKRDFGQSLSVLLPHTRVETVCAE